MCLLQTRLCIPYLISSFMTCLGLHLIVELNYLKIIGPPEAFLLPLTLKLLEELLNGVLVISVKLFVNCHQEVTD